MIPQSNKAYLHNKLAAIMGARAFGRKFNRIDELAKQGILRGGK
jgi:hypothetical protein